MKSLYLQILVFCVLFTPSLHAQPLLCQSVFKDFQFEKIRGGRARTVASGPWAGIRQYPDPYFIVGRSERSLIPMLPKVVDQAPSLRDSFDSITAVMNYYFTGFGFKVRDWDWSFDKLLDTAFVRTESAENSELGDLITFSSLRGHFLAMVRISPKIVWTKPAENLPAGFYNYSDIISQLTKGLEADQYDIHFYHPHIGGRVDYYSPKIKEIIDKGRSDLFGAPGFHL